MIVKRFQLLGAEGGGYLLGPRAEMSSWLLCLSDVKDRLSGGGNKRRGEQEDMAEATSRAHETEMAARAFGDGIGAHLWREVAKHYNGRWA